jgi:hypothetical protein
MVNNANSYGTDNTSNNHSMSQSQEIRSINQGLPPPPPPSIPSSLSLSPSDSLPNLSLSSTPDRSSIFADIKSGIGGINLKKVPKDQPIDDNRRNTTGSYKENIDKEEEKGRFSTGMMGGSAVAAILARRKFLQEDESGSDNDSDDGWG